MFCRCVMCGARDRIVCWAGFLSCYCLGWDTYCFATRCHVKAKIGDGNRRRESETEQRGATRDTHNFGWTNFRILGCPGFSRSGLFALQERQDRTHTGLGEAAQGPVRRPRSAWRGQNGLIRRWAALRVWAFGTPARRLTRQPTAVPAPPARSTRSRGRLAAAAHRVRWPFARSGSRAGCAE